MARSIVHLLTCRELFQIFLNQFYLLTSSFYVCYCAILVARSSYDQIFFLWKPIWPDFSFISWFVSLYVALIYRCNRRSMVWRKEAQGWTWSPITAKWRSRIRWCRASGSLVMVVSTCLGESAREVSKLNFALSFIAKWIHGTYCFHCAGLI
jgi:hypothetical protein